MAEHAPAAISFLGSRVRPDLGGQLSGIVGDQAHTYGYHRARFRLPSSDYSVRLTEDRQGNGEAASAIDMSFDTTRMKLYTARLRAAVLRRDPRIQFVREFYGTLNGSNVFGMTHDGSGDLSWNGASADSTHLWHIHISFLRKFSNDRPKMQGLLDILMGKPLGPTQPTLTKGPDMFFIVVKPTGAMFASNGVTKRALPGGTYSTMVQPLQRKGVPTLTVANDAEATLIGGNTV